MKSERQYLIGAAAVVGMALLVGLATRADATTQYRVVMTSCALAAITTEQCNLTAKVTKRVKVGGVWGEWENVAGAEVDFSLTGDGKLTPTTATTNSAGECSVTLSYKDNPPTGGARPEINDAEVTATHIASGTSTEEPAAVTYRYPTSVVQVANSRVNTVYNGVPNAPPAPPGPLYWGHKTAYKLKVLDNLTPAGHYGHGKPSEAFQNAVHNPQFHMFDTQPSNPSTWGTGAVFQDVNFSVATGDTGMGTFWYSFDQVWHVLVPDNGNEYDYPLNTHAITHYQEQAIRNY